ncbi:MAG: sterol desaturase family protein, partial [Parvularculaceae bacterium]
FFIHTETIHKFPRAVEWLMNTPSHHRVHHGRNPRYLDANYAGVFIIWDRLFGTFVPENATDPVDYGLITNLETQNPFKVAVHEYLGVWRDLTQTDISWRDRLFYLIARPGWCHDGSRQTSLEIQREWRNALRDNKVTGQTRL